MAFMSLASFEAISGPTVISKIDKIRVKPTIAYIKLESCQRYNTIVLDSEYSKAMYSAALTAATAGKPVKVEFSDDNGCQTTESSLKMLEVQF